MYTYDIKRDIFNKPTAIEFGFIENKIEFLKHLFQILGMYNFIIKIEQKEWQKQEPQVEINAPNGTIFLKIKQNRKVVLLANENIGDLRNIGVILNKFSVFKKNETQIEELV